MAMPLDSSGFLRRQCPTCEREFKWLPSSVNSPEGAALADDSYFCPYCGVQAPAGAWFTEAQLALARNTVAREIIAPAVSKLGDYKQPEKLDPLTEADDMTRVVFSCHPSEPLKILDGWATPVRCLICGTLESFS